MAQATQTDFQPAAGEVIDKLPPQNLEAEQSILGALMIDKNAIHRVIDQLKPEDFYRKKHQIIFETCVDLYQQTEPIDILRVSARLDEKKQLETVGGRTFLTKLVNAVPTTAHLTSYTKIVSKKKMLRDLIGASHAIAALGYKEDEDIQSTLDQAEKMVFEVANQSHSHEFSHIKAGLEGAVERMHMLAEHKGDGLRGVPTGLIDLDNKLSGLQDSDLVIVAARPSVGKTSLALEIARYAGAYGKKSVGIFSLEMSSDQLIDRLIAAEAGVNLWKLRTGNLSDKGKNNDFERIQHAIGVLSEAPIYIDDEVSPNLMHMRATARRLQAQKGLDLLVIDYIQLMHGLGKNDSRVNEVSEISRGLKGLARELNIPVIALSQLSRAVEARAPQVPQLSDLRESGSIEQDADVVLFLYRQSRDKTVKNPEPNTAQILVEKHRNGPTGRVDVFFEESEASFKSLAKQEEPAGPESTGPTDTDVANIAPPPDMNMNPTSLPDAANSQGEFTPSDEKRGEEQPIEDMI